MTKKKLRKLNDLVTKTDGLHKLVPAYAIHGKILMCEEWERDTNDVQVLFDYLLESLFQHHFQHQEYKVGFVVNCTGGRIKIKFCHEHKESQMFHVLVRPEDILWFM